MIKENLEKVEVLTKLIFPFIGLISENVKKEFVWGLIDVLNKKYLKGEYHLKVSSIEQENDKSERNLLASNAISSEIMKNAAKVYRLLLENSDDISENGIALMDCWDDKCFDGLFKKKYEQKNGTFNIPKIDLLETFGYDILNAFADKAYNIAKSVGFHKDGDGVESYDKLASYIANEHGELSELWEAYRKQELDKPCGKATEEELNCFDEELADSQIRLWDRARAFGRNLGRAVRIKMKYNASRPFRHGGKIA